MRLTELQFKKYSDDQVRYESLIADLEKIEKASPVVGLYLTDSNIDAENAGVSHDHPDFYELCYHSACAAAGFRAEEHGLDINKLLGRSIY